MMLPFGIGPRAWPMLAAIRSQVDQLHDALSYFPLAVLTFPLETARSKAPAPNRHRLWYHQN